MVDEPEAPILYEFRKNSRERVVARLKSYRGMPLADLRVFATIEDGHEAKEVPTSKGISICVDKLAELQAAVNALVDAAAPQAERKPRAA